MQAEPTWGIWALPESQLRLLPDDMRGVDAIELGRGTAYVSAWMVRRGARVVGIDNSERQWATATRLMEEHSFVLDLIQGNAEQVPRLESSFDFAISEYGAVIWCDPERWIPEAHRLLRPGGRLTFLGTHPLANVCSSASGGNVEDRFHRPYFEMHTLDWRDLEKDPGSIEFNLTQADWLALFRDTGFEVTNYLELRAPTSATGERFDVPAEWARRWPSEQAWQLRKQL